MAENESLDIGNRRSRRWREMRDLIRTGAPYDAVARAVIENLYLTFKRVVKQVPLEVLLDAILTRGDVRGVIRACGNHEYAQLIAMQYQPGLSQRDTLEHALWATVDRFLDQIALNVVGSPNCPDVLAFAEASAAWQRGAFDGVRELARKLATDPERSPRLPSRTAEQKRQDSARLISMSLLGDRGHVHDQG